MKEPFINLFDVAGILMLCILIVAVLAALGSPPLCYNPLLHAPTCNVVFFDPFAQSA